MVEPVYNLMLKNYQIDNIVFVINQDFVWPKERGIEIKPTFNRKIIDHDGNSAFVNITIDIPKEENTPFSLHLSIVGFFELKQWKKTEEGKILMSNNASAVLFPYLRQAVTTITTLGGLPPYTLPVMNMATLFKTKE